MIDICVCIYILSKCVTGVPINIQMFLACHSMTCGAVEFSGRLSIDSCGFGLKIKANDRNVRI